MHWNIFIFRLFHYLQIVVQYTEKNNVIVSILSCVCFVFWEFTHGFWILREKSQHWRTVTISDLSEVGLTPAVFMRKRKKDRDWHFWMFMNFEWRAAKWRKCTLRMTQLSSRGVNMASARTHTHTTQTKSSVHVWVAFSGTKVIRVHPGKKKCFVSLRKTLFIQAAH